MPTIQSTFFTGMGRPDFGNRYRANTPIFFRHTHTFLTTVATTDVLELFEFPAFASFAEFRCISANVGAINLDIGVMTGTLGDTVATRTLGSLLIDDGAANTTLTATIAARTTVGKNGDQPRGIGLVPASNITAAANKTLTFEVMFF